LNQATAFRAVLEQMTEKKIGLMGAMLESNLRAGRQDVIPGVDLIPGISITDECIGFDETEELILEAYNRIG
jgi:3-deoxy-7-phosphoheptulonate synthase